MAVFAPDPAFIPTSHEVGELPLCHVRLQDDDRYPWLVLIPRKPGLREIEELSAADRGRLMDEAVLAGGAIRAVGQVLGLPVEKLNLGALGNVTAQLHLHVVGRRSGDPAWPGPVWGHSAGAPYQEPLLYMALSAARAALG
jgi:diadenosine tetraphosphate (Ap4A) HIT family hydrolase